MTDLLGKHYSQTTPTTAQVSLGNSFSLLYSCANICSCEDQPKQVIVSMRSMGGIQTYLLICRTLQWRIFYSIFVKGFNSYSGMRGRRKC